MDSNTRVLLVDDEKRIRDSLRAVLGRGGFEVRTAESGREAIDQAVGWQPDLLVSDWMLCDHLHGLHVSQALQVLYPAMRTVLMTGYPSDDLRADAASLGITEFLEKPFEVDSLLSAIATPSTRAVSREPEDGYGLLSLGDDGAILYANPRARELFAAIGGPPETQRLGDLVVEVGEVSDAAVHRWTRVSGIHAPERSWWVRSSESTPRIVALLPGELDSPRADPAIQMLLAIHEPLQTSWDLDERVLVLERDSAMRDLYVSRLQQIGCICYKAEGPQLALDLLRADPQIQVVVIDRESVGGVQLSQLVHRVHMIRTGVKIVGSSSSPRDQTDFSALGVHRFIDKPWRTGDLIDALRN